jgi:hypothetical protein
MSSKLMVQRLGVLLVTSCIALGCGGGDLPAAPSQPGSEPTSQVIRLDGGITISDLGAYARGQPVTLIEAEALLNGRVVGIARAPQGQAAVMTLTMFLIDLPLQKGRNTIGFRLTRRLPGSGPYSIWVHAVAVEGPNNLRMVAEGDFRTEKFVDAGDTVLFDFIVP